MNSSNPKDMALGAIVLGEIGRVMDISTLKGVANTAFDLISHAESDVRNAGSHALGTMTVGNISFFFPQLVSFMHSPDANVFLLMLSLKEVIICEKGEMKDISSFVDILFEHASHPEENVRNTVAECIGKLFIRHGEDVATSMIDKEVFTTNNLLLLETVARSLKFAC